MLWLALHLPRLPLEVHTRGSAQPAPSAVTELQRGSAHVLVADARAAQAGAYPGLALSAAHALIATLKAYERDPKKESAALEALAALCFKYTPTVSLMPPQALLLEIEGSLRLFGGVQRLMQAVQREVKRLGYGVQAAVAATPLAALWLARAGKAEVVRKTDELTRALAPLPIAVLELPAAAHDALRQMGVRYLRELLRLPRTGLARRLGPALVTDLDRALGQAADPRRCHQLPPEFHASLALPAPVADSEALLFAAHRQLLELAAFLEARCAGVRRIEWRLKYWRKPAGRIAIECAQPQRQARHFLQLLRSRLEREPIAAAVETLELHAGALEDYVPPATDIFPNAPRQRAHGRAALVERLRARLGEAAVQGLSVNADHRPEQAFRYCAPDTAKHAHLVLKRRPLWLLPEPLPLDQRDQRPYWAGALLLEAGPERIESGWWDGQPVTRDYYVACSSHGQRLWVFRERQAPRRWFLHGLFS
jgi:protein ImuB